MKKNYSNSSEANEEKINNNMFYYFHIQHTAQDIYLILHIREKKKVIKTKIKAIDDNILTCFFWIFPMFLNTFFFSFLRLAILKY